MADKIIKSVNLLPEFLRTDRNSKFLSSTIDQLIQKPQVERLDGYIGDTETVTYNSTADIYISETLPLRRNYQLDPALVIRDSSDNVTDVVALDDLVNELSIQGSKVDNFDRLFRPEFYSYNPHIDWDKLINYQQYYWLVTGPNVITIDGSPKNSTSTYTVVNNRAKTAFVFTPDGLTANPLISLYRGNTYHFKVDSSFKFYIKTSATLGTGDQFNFGVTNNGTSTGIISVTIDNNTPDTLFYVSDTQQYAQGQISVKAVAEDSQINVETDIIGKKHYTSGNNVVLSNGMKIRFGGDVYPEFYRDRDFFVEGVGIAIRLVEYDLLNCAELPTATFNENFDATPFDDYPFDSFKKLPLTPDYITINRASRDLNPWSRYNRWVHKDVITASALATGQTPVYPANLRAKRPIIEFEADFKLFNFGSRGIENVDLIDTETTDAFSLVEGSAGHHVDGVQLAQGHRVIFVADTDNEVRGKIYQVNYIGINNRLRLTLEQVDAPATESVVAVNYGKKYTGTSWWFNGDEWKYSQQKTALNQAPLFDLYDYRRASFSDLNYYVTSFSGNKVFGYDIGSGSADPILGFPLNYRNSIGVGSYLFKNYFMDGQIVLPEDETTIPTSTTFFKIGDNFFNTWSIADPYKIPLLKSDIATTVGESNYYETPLGLTNNPLNENADSFTLSEISDHVKSMVVKTSEFTGNFPGDSNLRDLSNISAKGNRFITNKNPMSFAHFFLGKKEHNAIDAITIAADQYNQFRMAFLKKIASIGLQTDPVTAVDIALKELNVDKDVQSPYYLSDMIAYGSDKNTRTWTITNPNISSYPITSAFDATGISRYTYRSVLVYLNGVQLIHGAQYDYSPTNSAVQLLVTRNKGDILVVEDYRDTRGSFIPPTPTKLGLYPKSRPYIYDDGSYVNGLRKSIKCHDGSIMAAYNDYRDDIILEFEKRVYNNIKFPYNSNVFEFMGALPGAFRKSDYSVKEVNEIIQRDFIKWSGTYGIDYQENTAFDQYDPFTWNYAGSYNREFGIELSGSWRSIFNYFYDTDTPNYTPWEMLGFTEYPTWWASQYGPAPYTSGNELLWRDLEQGLVRQGYRAGVHVEYARPGLSKVLPVDDQGRLVDPTQLIATNVTAYNRRQPWKFGDHGAAETAWRRSSYWPFVIQKLLALTSPASYASLMYDPIKTRRNLSGQWDYEPNFEFLKLKNVSIHGETDTITNSGYSVYVSEIGLQRTGNYIKELRSDLDNADFNLFYKAGGFVNKNKLQITIDSIEPTSTSQGALLPPEDYSLILNVSNPIKSTAISGVIVQKNNGKFIVKGYDNNNPYFTVYTVLRNTDTPTITVGGVSDPYITWASSSSIGQSGLSSVDTTTANSALSGTYYQQGQIVKYGNYYYRVKNSHRSGDTFVESYFQRLPALPIIGGATVQIASTIDSIEKNIPYGTEFNTIQEVYDLLIGYGAWLKGQGFYFDEYNSELQSAIDWDFTCKEFLYWTTQNWASQNIITLSPFANQIKFKNPASVVDNIFNSFYEYSILQANGRPFPKTSLSVDREDGVCTIKTLNSFDGIYFARLNSVQKEHGLVFKNRTMFNDVIYDKVTGYRQHRMKVKGFRTANWDGDYFSPGFIYDEATVTDWKTYTNYRYGDVVRFNGNYYSAKQNVASSEKFDFTKWVPLGEKPVAALLSNFDYKISQFEDFYSLDIDNFDSAQQKMAQHLTGYTPRVYLNNIFTDPIAQYKFYQGFIKEKGTKNAISKLSKATIHNLQGQIDYNEEWAFRVGYYGSYETYKEIEVPLVEGGFIENPQVINFVETTPTTPNDLIYYSLPADLSITPIEYKSTATFTTETGTDSFQLATAGYARFDDVDFTLFNESEILTLTNTNLLVQGTTIWVGSKNNGDWDVLKYNLDTAKLVSMTSDTEVAGTIEFYTDYIHNLSVGDVVSVNEFDDRVNGVYKIQSVPGLNRFIVVNSSTVVAGTITPSSPGLLFKFVSARNSTFDNLPSDQTLLELPEGSKLWVDDNGNNKWSVYQKIKNYHELSVSASTSPTDQKLGWSISRSSPTNIFMVGSPGYTENVNTGNVSVYYESGNSIQLKFRYGINTGITQYYSLGDETGFGWDLAYDSQEFIDSNGPTGYGLMFVGAPLTSKVKSNDAVGSLRYASGTGSASSRTQEGLVKISSVDGTLIEEKTQKVLLSPYPSNYERFGTSIYEVATSLGKLLLVGAPQTNSLGTGTVYSYWVTTSTVTTGTVDISYKGKVINPVITLANTGSQWGSIITGSDNAEIIAISAPGYDSNKGLVTVFVGTTTQFLQTIYSPFDKYAKFGTDIAVSPTGNYMCVTASEARNSDQSYGKVAIYKRTSSVGTFTLLQIISNPVIGVGMKFGQAVDINPDATEIVASAIGTNRHVSETFDKYSLLLGTQPDLTAQYVNDPNSTQSDAQTTFDLESTTFFDAITYSGTAYVYNRKNNLFRLADELIPPDTTTGTNFGFSIALNQNSIYVGSPAYKNSVTPDLATSSFYQFYKKDTTAQSLNLLREQDNLISVNAIQKVSLIDTFNEEIVEYLDVIDPLKGKISGLAEQEIRYKSSFDPAIYAIGTDATVNDPNTCWMEEHVGDLWWDLSTVKYSWYEQGSLEYRKNNWGRLFPGSSIDVYEWVGSTYLPSQWAAFADTTEGLALGISGQPKHPDNSVVSAKQFYNSINDSFTNYYYFWVKNKLVVPNVKNRRINSYQVSSLIANPTIYGLQYASIIAKDAVVLANVGNLLVDNRIHLNIASDTISNEIPRHTEWLLLQDGLATSRPNALLEKKLMDSLLGHDSLGNTVPDPALSARARYGVGIRPRQTMFKDRLSALRNIVEFANDVLSKERITGNYSFENLNKQEIPPDEYSHEYDQVVEDNEALLLIDTRQLVAAELSCTIKDGKIRSVSIDKTGAGYKISPVVTIEGGNGAEIVTTINSRGHVISAEIKNAGEGLATAPRLTVRPYTVIVLADTSFTGKWTKFIYDKLSDSWIRAHTQEYNTSLYWDYIDWSSDTYNQFLDYSATVNEVYELDTLTELTVGSYVKVNDAGLGTYIIVEKTSDGVNGTFDSNFNIVYAENGTIKILDNIWNFSNSNLSYDNNSAFDQTLFDQIPDIELHYLLTALRDDLFVNALKINWNLLFFKAVKYALSEQKLLDWAFKTSFINVINYAGDLDQRPIYKLQNSQFYEDYIGEVKPYHTSIRNFTTNYTVLEPSQTYVTDFDLPSVYDNNLEKFITVNFGNPLMNTQPWKAWADNYLFGVGEISIGNPGAGYTFPPKVDLITEPGDTGSGATAEAYIRSGEVYDIIVTNPGQNYSRSPRVVIQGGGSTGLINAVAYAKLSNGKVRENTIGIRFDRTSRQSETGNLNTIDAFVCDGSTNEFILSWVADPDKNKIVATLDGELVLNSDYTIKYYTEYSTDSQEYLQHKNKIIFLNYVPLNGQTLEISYIKSTDVLNSVDRILNYYTPKSGMPGLDLGQLMTGIVYPQASIQGLTFDYSTKWDTYLGFDRALWADEVGTYFSAVTTASSSVVGGTWTNIAVSDISGITVGQSVNVISTSTPIFRSSIAKVVGINPITKVITVNTTTVKTIPNTSTIEFWSYSVNSALLDSAIIGGTWNAGVANGALGINPEDVIIDGDRFISSDNSYAPEELVPGHVAESLGINVYTKNPEGAPVVLSSSFFIDSNSTATRIMSIVPPSYASVMVSYANTIFSYNTNTNFTTSTQYAINWTTNELIIPPQGSSGLVRYTVISIGGGRPDTEAGVIDSATIIPPTSSAQVQSLAGIDSVRSAYVTVNGQSIPAVSTSTEYGYILTYADDDNRRAVANVYNLSTATGPNVVTAWFFGFGHKYFNEIHEQIINVDARAPVGTYTEIPYALENPPGEVEPFVANAIVEFYNTSTGGRSMLTPPHIDYYKVEDPADNSYAINNVTSTGALKNFDLARVRTYINGSELKRGFDFTVGLLDGVYQVTINSALLSRGDVIAILGKPGSTADFPEQDYHYDIVGSNLLLCAPVTNFGYYGWNTNWSGEIKVITYNNQDDMLIRTEVFNGNPSRRYKISRPVLDENYIWITVNGIPLVNFVDFEILEDQVTVQVSDWFNFKPVDKVVIITFSSEKLSSTILGHRIFNDLFNRTHFKRLSKQNTTYLTKPLTFTDTEIFVADLTVLARPSVEANIPGVVIIDGERIEFFKTETRPVETQTLVTATTIIGLTRFGENVLAIDTGTNYLINPGDFVTIQGIPLETTVISTVSNRVTLNNTASIALTTGTEVTFIRKTYSTAHVLAQLRRSTLGTAPSFYSQENTKVIDQSIEQTVPFDESILVQNTLTGISTAYTVYKNNHISKFYTDSVNTGSFNNNGIILSTASYINSADQISVYYGGRLLNKLGTYHQDINISYDSPIINTVNFTTSTETLPYTTIIGTAYVTTLTNQVWVYTQSNKLNAVNGYEYRGLMYRPPEFSVVANEFKQEISLNIPEGVQPGVRLTMVKRQFAGYDVWNDVIVPGESTKSLMDSTTVPARFLQARPAELPDKYYYGGDPALFDDSGFAVTDDQGNTLQGF